MAGYDHRAIEKKWQQRWAEGRAYDTPDKKDGAENFYFLTEFPYPSGNLHVGHWYAFSVPDIFARYLRARGYNVLYPIGFDAFGLPAENAAIKRGLNPRQWTFDNMDAMRAQLRSMGASFDWSREVVTCDPAYYRWTQWLFLQFYKKGLVYRKETAVNWCPQDKTVLANEQVVDGRCERCGEQVVQKNLPQWNIKITDYADRLIDELAGLDWPKQIKDAQINWIGRSEGAEIEFKIKNEESRITVFTTRPDTLFGATYLVVAPEHPLAAQLGGDAVQHYIAQSKKKTELERTENKEKTGVELQGVKAVNPATKEEIPVYVADYVLATYGTGAIMAVPAHDERDYEFAKKFNLPIKQVVAPYTVMTGSEAPRSDENIVRFDAATAIIKHWEKDLYYVVDFSPTLRGFVGGHIEAGETPEQTARREVTEESGYTDIKSIRPILEHAYSRGYKSRKQREEECHDRLFFVELGSGARKDIIDKETKKGGWLASEEILRIPGALLGHHKLFFDHYLHEGPFAGGGVLVNSGEFSGLNNEEAKKKITEFVGGRAAKQYHLRDWVVSRQRFWGVPIPMIRCKACALKDASGQGYQPVPEAQLPVVLPELDDYMPTGEGKSPLAKKRDWVEVVCPACGGNAERETDTLDTFVDSSWYFQRYTDPNNETAFAAPDKLKHWLPVDLYSGGSEHTTMHVLYSRFWHKAMFDLGLVGESEPYLRRMNRGLIMGPDGQKMSKSRGNVIDPDAVVAELGADTVRMYLAFIGPYNEVGSYPWNPQAAVGVRRFLDKVWRLQVGPQGSTPDQGSPRSNLGTVLHRTIKKVGEDIASLKMNTAVSALMILLGALEKEPAVPGDVYAVFVQLLAPFAPHLCHELAERHGVDLSAWPAFDPAQLAGARVAVAVQVNGRVRASVELSPDASEGEALQAARAAAAKWITGPEKRAVYVPGRVVNIVV